MRNDREELRYLRAKKKVKQIKEFYGHLLVYCIVVPTLIFLNLKFTPQFHWFWFSMLGWGIGLASHGLQTFGGYKLFLGEDWEERKIKELMEKEYRNGK